jgi:RND family efflux transporter MFP subunit
MTQISSLLSCCVWWPLRQRSVWPLLLGLMGSVAQAQQSPAELVGLVYPVADIQFGVPVAGVVQRLLVKPGQVVGEGQPLLELDSQSQRLELQRRALVARDSSELEATQSRLKVLDEMLQLSELVASRSQSVSKEELAKQRLERMSTHGRLQQLQAQKSREQVELQLAQTDLAQRTVRAPRPGMVVEVLIEAGEWAKPGDPIFRLVDTGQVELRVNLPQAVARSLRTGQRLLARFESGAAPLQAEGVVHFLSPLADTASGLVDMRVRFANPKGLIRPGAKGSLLVSASSPSPASARKP